MAHTLLLEKDIPILDSILETVIKKGEVYPDDLSPIGKSSLSEISSVKFGKYKYYFEIIECFDVLKINNISEGYSFRINLIEVKSKMFYENGGFKAIFEDQQREIKRKSEREKMEDEKLRSDLKISLVQGKTIWWAFGISILSITIATIALIVAFFKG